MLASKCPVIPLRSDGICVNWQQKEIGLRSNPFHVICYAQTDFTHEAEFHHINPKEACKLLICSVTGGQLY